MKPKSRIIRIKCPYCQERYMIASSKGYRSKFVYSDTEWKCLSCPIWIWQESWFNIFPQFEHLVTREGNQDPNLENVEI